MERYRVAVIGGPDLREGVLSFVEGRAPRFPPHVAR